MDPMGMNGLKEDMASFFWVNIQKSHGTVNFTPELKS